MDALEGPIFIWVDNGGHPPMLVGLIRFNWNCSQSQWSQFEMAVAVC